MFEEVRESVKILARRLRNKLETFADDETFYRGQNSRKAKDNISKMSNEWMENIKLPWDAKRPAREKL